MVDSVSTHHTAPSGSIALGVILIVDGATPKLCVIWKPVAAVTTEDPSKTLGFFQEVPLNVNKPLSPVTIAVSPAFCGTGYTVKLATVGRFQTPSSLYLDAVILY